LRMELVNGSENTKKEERVWLENLYEKIPSYVDVKVSVRGLYQEDTMIVIVQQHGQTPQKLGVSNDQPAVFHNLTRDQDYIFIVENEVIYDPTKHHPRFKNTETSSKTLVLEDLYEYGISHSNGPKMQEGRLDKNVSIKLVCSKKLLELTFLYRSLWYDPFSFQSHIVQLMIKYLQEKVSPHADAIKSLTVVSHSDWYHCVHSTSDETMKLWNYNTGSCLYSVAKDATQIPIALYISTRSSLLVAFKINEQGIKHDILEIMNWDYDKSSVFSIIPECGTIYGCVFFVGPYKKDYILLSSCSKTCEDWTLEIWDVETEKRAFLRNEHQASTGISIPKVHAICFAVTQQSTVVYIFGIPQQQGPFFVSLWRPFHDTIHTFDVTKERPAYFFIAADGKMLAVQSLVMEEIWFWDLTDVVDVDKPMHPPSERCLQQNICSMVTYVSEDHKYVVLAPWVSSASTSVFIYETATLELMQHIKNCGRFLIVTMTLESNAIMIGCDKTVTVYDVKTGNVLFKL